MVRIGAIDAGKAFQRSLQDGMRAIRLTQFQLSNEADNAQHNDQFRLAVNEAYGAFPNDSGAVSERIWKLDHHRTIMRFVTFTKEFSPMYFELRVWRKNCRVKNETKLARHETNKWKNLKKSNMKQIFNITWFLVRFFAPPHIHSCHVHCSQSFPIPAKSSHQSWLG